MTESTAKAQEPVINTTTDNLYNALKNVSRFRSNDPTLPSLYGVHMYVRNSNLIMEATDRYAIAQVVVEYVYTGPAVDVIITGDSVRGILRQFGRIMDRGDDVTITLPVEDELDQTMWITQTKPGMTRSFQINLYTNSGFPNVGELVDAAREDVKDGGTASHAGIQPKLLWAMAGVKDYRSNAGVETVFIQPGSKPHKPMFFGHEHDQELWIQGLVMPMRPPRDDDGKFIFPKPL